MKTVILDTSFLLACLKFKIDIKEGLENLLGSFEILIPDKIMDEIEKKEIKNFLESLNYRVVEIDAKNADESIKKLALNKNYFVATVDKKLKSYLKRKKIKTLYIRNFSKICLE
ncbi:MAG: hypothetical protein RMJ17_00050 [Candidatus Aenigmarchaeota archaeon]|nr:hypothetical protein [Candidatus Aenigmarchaeota archaeon]MDW8148983.1 hypothetical protein [Candidatus Aenigmarchaeota archaeon]